MHAPHLLTMELEASSDDPTADPIGASLLVASLVASPDGGAAAAAVGPVGPARSVGSVGAVDGTGDVVVAVEPECMRAMSSA